MLNFQKKILNTFTDGGVQSNIILGIFIIFIIGALIFSPYYWTHPELLGTSIYVWSDPNASLISMLRTVFDWKAFDPNVNRVRPLNDLFEVIDAIARPYFIKWSGVNTFPLPSTLLTIILVPSLLFAWGKRVIADKWFALALVMVFISSIAFLSITFSYIRPAKKINIICLAAMLLFMELNKSTKKDSDFYLGLLFCFLSFFADEQGLINWVVLAVFYWQECFKEERKKFLFFISMPFLFFIFTKWGLPALYYFCSAHGKWDALADVKKFTVFNYLINLQFYIDAATSLGRSVVSNFGFKSQFSTLIFIVDFLILIIPAVVFGVLKNQASYNWLKASSLMVVASVFFSLLDWYPFPYEVSYLGSFNYYYHSSMGVIIFCWLVFGVKVLQNYLIKIKEKFYMLSLIFTFFLAATIVYQNILLFINVNNMVRIIHYYPFDYYQINSAILNRTKTNNSLLFIRQPELEENKMNSYMYNVFGGPEQAGGFFVVLQMVKKTPILTEGHLIHMVKSFYPWENLSIKTE
jgi:hypothetical protein